MSLTAEILYGSGVGFTFDSGLIEFIDSKATLKLQDNPGQIFTQNFSDDEGFTYNSDEVEFFEGLIRQVDQRPSGATFYGAYTTTMDGNWGNGALTATNNGGTLNDGMLQLLGADTEKYVDYAAEENADSQQTGCFRIKIVPNYSGPPSSIQIFYRAGANGTNSNALGIQHSTTGQLALRVYNANATAATSLDLGPWSPVSGTEYEFELNWDIDSGATRLFIDGTQFGTTQTNTGTRSGAISLMRIGAPTILGSGLTNANFSVSSILMFSTVQHTANYIVGDGPSETIYITSTVELPSFVYSGVGTILSVDDSTVVEGGSPRYIVGGFYWDGAAWAESDGSYAQASSSATVIANLAELVVTGALSVAVSVVFPDTNTQSSVNSISVEVTGQIYSTSNPTVRTNTGYGQASLAMFTETAIKSGLDEIKYTFFYNGADHYILSGALAVSNGTYSQASSAAEILAALPLDIDPDATVLLKAFLHSETGQTTPALESVSIDYALWVDDIEPGQCVVYGYILDRLTPVSGASITITTETPFFKNGNLISINETIETSAQGYFSITLPVSGTNQLKVAVSWTDSKGLAQATSFRITVPDETSSEMEDLLA